MSTKLSLVPDSPGPSAPPRAPVRAILREHLHMSRLPHPAAVVSPGRVAITLHAVDDGDEWRWTGGDEFGHFGLVFPVDDAEVSIDDIDLAPGQMPVLLRHGRTMALRWRRGAAATVWIPNDAIDDLGVDIARVPERPALTTSALAGRSYVRTIASVRPSLSALEALVLERTLIDIAFALFVAAGERDVVATTRVSTYLRVRLHFESRFTDPDFSVRSAASEIHVSERHIERMFARRGSSPSAYLRSLRVDFARALLATRDETGMTMQAIAGQSGFASARSLRRALADG